MAAVDDLIAQVSDARLRERLTREWAEAKQGRKFGLVFEQHLPELLVMPRAKPRAGCRVCLRGDDKKAVWQVRRVADGMAFLVRDTDDSGARQELNAAVDRLEVVRQFGDPIFPALTPVERVQNGAADAPWHTLIEADNYHALQLLEYLYAGKIDCIYIDPPYNTGARDWKYNNDYVDRNDAWRHSKWLAFMERRLRLAKRLLKPDDGVLIVTIDTNELHHMGILLAELFPEAKRNLITICITPSGTSGEGLSRVEEYAVFCFLGRAEPVALTDDMLLPPSAKRSAHIRWEALMRGGTAWYRKKRDHLCYPVILNADGTKVVDVGSPLPFHRDDARDTREERGRPSRDAEGRPLAWPVRNDGRLGIWRVDGAKLKDLARKGYAYVSSRDENRGTWTIRYLLEGTVNSIAAGEILVTGEGERGQVLLERTSSKKTVVKTMWVRGRHTAGGAGGTTLISDVLARRNAFSFPKSVYSTKDALDAAIGNRRDALILDFFAGSGTTLNAVNLLNAIDGGQRRCILVTNNEVSGDEADALSARGLKLGDDEWDAHGICQSVTWPRSKYTILGKRDDGTVLEGEYLTGKTREAEKARKFIHIGFVDPSDLDTVPKRKQLVALIDGLPQTLVKADTRFVISESHDASVLFDPAAKDEWLEALEGQDHIARFFVIAPRKADFDAIKAEVQELLGPLIVTEEEKRPMAEGFAANLEYFRLDFLDPARVQLRRAFREILPLLWLKAGAVGPRPTLARDAEDPDLLLPEGSNFAVLLQESKLRKAIPKLAKAPRLDVMYLVTDDEESFRAMSDAVRDARGEAGEHLETVQLYRNYLDNFVINRADGAEGARP